MKWIQMMPIECGGCGEEHDLFHIFFRRDGMLGFVVKCKCGIAIEHSVRWEDALEFSLNSDPETKAEKCEQKKSKKKPNGHS